MEPLWFILILPLPLKSEKASLFTTIQVWLTSNEVWRHKANSNRTVVWTCPSSLLQHLQSQAEKQSWQIIIFFETLLSFSEEEQMTWESTPDTIMLEQKLMVLCAEFGMVTHTGNTV